jgi:drug/metabolite transporter (DMT)-like permease
MMAGYAVLGEKITPAAVASLCLILLGVGVVLWGAARNKSSPPLRPDDAEETET